MNSLLNKTTSQNLKKTKSQMLVARMVLQRDLKVHQKAIEVVLKTRRTKDLFPQEALLEIVEGERRVEGDLIVETVVEVTAETVEITGEEEKEREDTPVEEVQVPDQTLHKTMIKVTRRPPPIPPLQAPRVKFATPFHSTFVHSRPLNFPAHFHPNWPCILLSTYSFKHDPL